MIPSLLNTDGYDIEFVAEPHSYLVNSLQWPSVSQILQGLGISSIEFCPGEALFRGSQIHLACEYYDQGRLDDKTIPEDWKGYFEAYKAFRAAKPWEIIMIEKVCINPLSRYAGTIDRLYTDGDQYYLVDLKTGSIPPSTRFQLAAYANFFVSPASLHRVAVQLKADGKYNMKTWNEVSDLLDWQCLVRTYNIKKEMGHYDN